MTKRKASKAIDDTYAYFFHQASPEKLKFSIHAVFEAGLVHDHASYDEIMSATKTLIDEHVEAIRLTPKPESDDLPF